MTGEEKNSDQEGESAEAVGSKWAKEPNQEASERTRLLAEEEDGEASEEGVVLVWPAVPWVVLQRLHLPHQWKRRPLRVMVSGELGGGAVVRQDLRGAPRPPWPQRGVETGAEPRENLALRPLDKPERPAD